MERAETRGLRHKRQDQPLSREESWPSGGRKEAAKTMANTIGPQGWGRLGWQSYILKPVLPMTFRGRSPTESKAGGMGVVSLKREDWA